MDYDCSNYYLQRFKHHMQGEARVRTLAFTDPVISTSSLFFNYSAYSCIFLHLRTWSSPYLFLAMTPHILEQACSGAPSSCKTVVLRDLIGAQDRSRGGRWSWALIAGGLLCLVAECFLNSCFLDTDYVTLFRAAFETAISEVHKLLRTGGVPTFLTLLL